MAAISGVNGYAKAGANTILNITDWTADFSGDIQDTTAFQAAGAWRTNTGTVKKWSCKITGNFDGADTNGQVALRAGILNTYALTLYTDAVHNWSGSAILIGISDKASATGMVTTEYSFTGSGAATYA